MSWFTFFLLLIILAALGSAALFLHIEWSLTGWWFMGAAAASSGIAGIGLYAIPDFVRLLREDLKRG